MKFFFRLCLASPPSLTLLQPYDNTSANVWNCDRNRNRNNYNSSSIDKIIGASRHRRKIYEINNSMCRDRATEKEREKTQFFTYKFSYWQSNFQVHKLNIQFSASMDRMFNVELFESLLYVCTGSLRRKTCTTNSPKKFYRRIRFSWERSCFVSFSVLLWIPIQHF